MDWSRHNFVRETVLSESKLGEEESKVRSCLLFRVDTSVLGLELLFQGISDFRLSVISDLVFLNQLLEVTELFDGVSILIKYTHY